MLRPKNIYVSLLVAACMGVIAPLFSVMAKMQQHQNLNEALLKRLNSEALVEIAVKIINNFPNFYGTIYPFIAIELYLKWVFFSILTVIILILFKHKVIFILEKLCQIYEGQKILLLAIVFIAITFISRLFLGFWFFGIGGWGYSHIKAQDLPLQEKRLLDKQLQSSLLLGIRKEYFKKFFNDECLKGTVILGHTDNNIFAINNSLSGYIFPDLVLDNNRISVLNLFNYRKTKINSSSSFFKKIRYPDHSVYNEIPAGQLSTPDSFKRIEEWEVLTCIKESEVYIAEAHKLSHHD